MNQQIESACVALDALATAVVTAWGADNTLNENFGWHSPAVTRQELAGMASSLAADIRSTEANEYSQEMAKLIQDLPRRIQLLQSNTVPQLFSGNAGQAVPAYAISINIFRSLILPGIGYQLLPDTKSLPSSLARRARAAQAELDQIAPNLALLSKQIEDIQSAHKVADSLPIDLQTLSEANNKVTKASISASLNEAEIEKSLNTSLLHLNLMEGINSKAEKIMEQCEDAYHITTTKGLAGAFDQRAGKLAWSMWAWVGGLVVALGLGSLIGSHRLELLSAALQAPNPNWGGVLIQTVLSLLSVGAPLWFAWLATKQIGQRFKLAEDYAFKASVAKAYEGYRKEAARIDPAFEARLFGSTLTRLDEAPLRLVDVGSHGSPWHELANSDAVRRAFDAAPDLRDKAFELLRNGISSIGKITSEKKPTPNAQEAAKE
jgi:hypothetical protein